MFHGSMVALVTPMHRDGAIDEDSLQQLVDFHVENHTDAIVTVGTTGESATLDETEHCHVIRRTVQMAAGRIPVIAGTGANSTREAIVLTGCALDAGADACLLVTPYYNKPTQEGLYRHYKAIQDAVEIPIVIYNIPGRCVVDMTVETMARLAALPNIIGVKDATCDLVRPAKTRLAIGAEFAQLSGEDATVVPFLAQGGHGCISVTANVAPRLCAELHEAWQGGDLESVQTINDRLMPLHEALFAETSPAPVKYAASLLGKCRNIVRQPLVEVSEQTEARVRTAMAHAGLIN